VLAVLGDDGYPYTVPINYAYKDGKIYLHCGKSGHKLDAIEKEPKVSFCVIEKDDVVPEKLTTYYRDVVVFGKAHRIKEEDQIRNATRILGLKYIPHPERIEKEIENWWSGLACIEIEIEHISGKEYIELVKADSNKDED
jgi:hypothetical protein